MTLVLVAPPLDGPVSGGTLFNRAIETRVREAGHSVRVVQHFEDTDEFAWVDSLYLEPAASMWSSKPLGLLAHYLPSLVLHPDGLRPDMLRPDERAALHHARAIVCPSVWMSDTLRGLGAEGSLRVLEPPLPSDATPGPLPSGPPRLVVVGAVTPGKGLLALLEQLASKPPRNPWTLEVIGSMDADPGYARRCQAQARDLPVRFVGPLRPADCLASTASAHGLVSASVMESYGMAIAQAQACGVPVLALSRGNAAVLARRPGSVAATSVEHLANAFRDHVAAPEALLRSARSSPRTQAADWTTRAIRALAAPP